MTLQDLIKTAIDTSRNFDIYADVSEGCFLLDLPASTEETEDYRFFADAQWIRNHIEETGNSIDLLLDEVNDIEFGAVKK